MDQNQWTCLFCLSNGPFSDEHIIPESLGNDDLILTNQICSKCNNHFSKLEEYVLQKTPLALWRTFLGIQTKKRKLPSVNISQPKQEKGRFSSVHPKHDSIGFTAHDDGSTSVDVFDPNIINEISSGQRDQFRLVLTPKTLFNLGRFMCKMGIELVCQENPQEARLSQFEIVKSFSRFGKFDGFWPIFHFSNGHPNDFRRCGVDTEGFFERVDCYSYQLLQFGKEYVLFCFGMGSDNWIVSLNDPYPSPEITKAFPGMKLNCIWYSPEEMKSKL